MMNFLRYFLMLPLCLLLFNSVNAQRIFWVERSNDRIMVGDLTPTSIVNATPYINSLSSVQDIAVDPSRNYFFYTLQGGEALVRSNYDGSSPVVLRDFGAFTGFNEIAYSENAEGVYGTHFGDEGGGVTFHPADGSTALDLSLSPYGNDLFEGIAVDDGNEQVFMVNYDNNQIMFSDFSGTSGVPIPISGNAIREVAVDIYNSKLYFSSYVSGSTYAIYSSNLNGSSQTQLVTVSNEISSIQVYARFGKVYFAAGTTIYHMNLDGTGLTAILDLPGTGLSDVGLEFDYTSPVFTALAPADNNLLVNPSLTQVSLTFNENVRISTDAGVGTSIDIFENGSSINTLPRNSSNISVSNNVVTITLPVALSQLKDYHIIIGGNVIEDLSGNNFIGINLATGWNFSTICTSLTAGTSTGDQSICSGGDPSILTGGIPTGGDDNFTYQWQSSTTSTTGGFSDISSAIAADFDPPAGIGTTTYFRRVVYSATCTPAVGNPLTVIVIPPIVIDTEPASQETCENGSVTFFVEASGNSLSYQWQVDDGTGFTNISDGSIYSGATSFSLNVNAVASMNGYLFRCVVRSSGMCPVNSQGATLTVNPLPVVSNQMVNICEDTPGSGSALFDLTSLEASIVVSPAGLSLTWYSQAGSVVSPIANPSNVLITNTNSYFVEVVNVSTDCSVQSFVDFTINAKPTLLVSPIPPITMCSGTPTVANLSGGSSYAWTVSSNPNITGASPGSSSGVLNFNLTNTSSTAQQITYGITPAVGTCFGALVNVMVTVNPVPTSFTITESGSNCEGAGGVIVGLSNSQPGVTYELIRNGSTTVESLVVGGGPLAFAPVTINGDYTVRGNVGSCSTPMTGTIPVQMVQLPSGIGAISGNTSTCAGLTESYQVSGISGATDYQWSFSDKISITSEGVNSIAALIEGTSDFTVNVVGENQCGTGGSAQLNVIMLPAPQVSIILPEEAYAEEEAVYSYTSPVTIIGDAWDFGDGGESSGQTVPYTYAEGGIYNITVEITSSTGCLGRDVQPFTVRPKASLSDSHIKNIITANGDEKNAFLYIEDILKFPNNEVLLLDRWGVEVYRAIDYDNTWDLRRDGDYLPAGNYVCVVRLNDTGQVFKRSITVLKSE